MCFQTHGIILNFWIFHYIVKNRNSYALETRGIDTFALTSKIEL